MGVTEASISASKAGNALRIVLFGMPGAGKTSLLAALAHASQSQERALGGRLTDRSNAIYELQRLFDQGNLGQTQAETVGYPIEFEPFSGLRPDANRREQFFLIDCDGRTANEILKNRDDLDDAPPGSLLDEVLRADGLVLVIDGSANTFQVEADLNEFVRFLRALEEQRGRNSIVGGLPVVIALTKADLLAKPGDSMVEWTGRIEKNIEEVQEKFREFLRKSGDDRLAFGDVQLLVTSTAIRWPRLSDAATQPDEPWHVAELFDDCFRGSQAFHQRQEFSARRLTWTILASLGFLGLLSLVAVGLVLGRKTMQPVALASKIESYRSREGQTASVRLSEPLQRKISELFDLKADAEFPLLNSGDQSFVKDRLVELEAYRNYKDQLQQHRSPAEARSEDELTEIEKQLQKDLALPANHASDWKQTEAAVLRDKWLDDCGVLRRGAREMEEYYRSMIDRVTRLLSFMGLTSDSSSIAWPRWQSEADALLRDGSPPFRMSDKLRDSRSVPLSRPVTFASIWNYPSVEVARGQWERIRGRLERLRDLLAALGLTTGAKPADLDFPERMTADQFRDHLTRLRADYPKHLEWSLSDVPDVAVPEVQKTAQASYRRLVAAGRAQVERLFEQAAPSGVETAAHWKATADLALNSPELRDWRSLANVLLRFAEPRAEDPLMTLVSFLKRDRFDLEIRGFRLSLPDVLKGQGFIAQSPLTVYMQAGGGPERKVTYRLDGKGFHDDSRKCTVYSYVVDGMASWPISVGDGFWADVPIRDSAGGDWKLSWWSNGARTSSYQFERIELPPRLHRLDQKIEFGDLVDSVKLIPVPDRAIPRVPDLVPDRR